MTTVNDLALIRRRLIGHGALLFFTGGVIGFGFLFFLLGEIRLWPIPGTLEVRLPGTYDAWRMAHMEAIINGAIVWLLAAVLSFLPFSLKGLRRIAYGMIIVAWTFVAGSLFDPLFPDSRGLAASGSLTNNLAFGIFYVGVVLVMGIMAVIAFRSLIRGDQPDRHAVD